MLTNVGSDIELKQKDLMEYKSLSVVYYARVFIVDLCEVDGLRCFANIFAGGKMNQIVSGIFAKQCGTFWTSFTSHLTPDCLSRLTTHSGTRAALFIGGLTSF
ncbi:uncharacterized protein [Fopius arisanus]|uniref:Uncharacterized protein n=1 Tax=Fopius arisanus TaxID=64838 RepID=A0A9R1THD7_9HYME|nr:PREDICTED: uncharacterized protein LOC105270979 [Fopius arisanus]